MSRSPRRPHAILPTVPQHSPAVLPGVDWRIDSQTQDFRVYRRHRYTGNSICLYLVLAPDSLEGSPAVKPQDFTPYLSGRLRALYAQ